MAGLHRIGRYFEARPLLVLLLLIDIILIALHVWLWSEGRLSPRFSIAQDDGLPEWFNYLNPHFPDEALSCAAIAPIQI